MFGSAQKPTALRRKVSAWEFDDGMGCDSRFSQRALGHRRSGMQSREALSSTPFPLSAVVATAELSRRAPRAPDFEAENRALTELAQTLGSSRGSTLQKLADVALDLCKAHSAGITLLEAGTATPVLRWRALAGKLAPHLGATLPRAFSPCGTTLDSNAIQLMSRPVRHFQHIKAWSPEIREALLIPFRRNGAQAGTIWVVAHDDTRRFDAEDARLITSLSKFAAAACDVLAAFQALEAKVAEGGNAAEVAIAADGQKDRFVSILGHELRGCLAPVRNAVELLKLNPTDAVTRRSITEIIDRQIGGMTRLIDDLLDVARLQNGHVQLRRTRAAVSEIIEHAVESVRPLAAARKHTLSVSVPPEPIVIDADVMWLSQALQNLLGNAAKYTNPGGVIGISAERDEDDVVITVSDNGIGIAPAELDTIFELYVQAGQARTERSAGGIGLGLYLARLLVEGHGGAIRAFSAGPDCGSRFIVSLPCRFR
jgi:signal transduction histidine kinase